MKEARGDDAIRLGPVGERRAGAGGVDWNMSRAIYMRVFGLIWLTKGLYGAALIIGLFGHPFQLLGTTAQVSTGFSAVGDCIAGVGLWLTVSWGAVIWIAVIVVEMGLALHGGAAPWPTLALLLPIIIYGVLGFLNARQTHERQ